MTMTMTFPQSDDSPILLKHSRGDVFCPAFHLSSRFVSVRRLNSSNGSPTVVRRCEKKHDITKSKAGQK